MYVYTYILSEILYVRMYVVHFHECVRAYVCMYLHSEVRTGGEDDRVFNFWVSRWNSDFVQEFQRQHRLHTHLHTDRDIGKCMHVLNQFVKDITSVVYSDGSKPDVEQNSNKLLPDIVI